MQIARPATDVGDMQLTLCPRGKHEAEEDRARELPDAEVAILHRILPVTPPIGSRLIGGRLPVSRTTPA